MNLLYKSSDESATSYICDETGYYLIRLQSKVSEQNYKAAYSAVLESAKTKPYQKIILSVIDDDENPLSVPFSARSWFASYFSPQFYKLAQNQVDVGIVKPKTKLQTNMMHVILGVVEKTNIKINAAYFDKEEEAKEWMKCPT
ncbi:STAS/SEC14 domain-containing protein [Bernardetia sp.]|uniref:STAS/SEC14 domain-containing protein n=1 Tax=Bernardetia sp. TaxID=1937974 RepID=UPI0025C2AEF5|nr:STAS/SEC14 domain-containing protein [Bernardetia sp.]